MSIARYTTYNLAGAIVPLVISLITVPIYLNLIGEARYGVLALAWVLLGYMGLFDLGLGVATAQAMSRLRDRDPDERRTLFWTAFLLNILLGVVAAGVLLAVGDYFFAHFDVVHTPDLRKELLMSLPWLALSVPITMLASMFHGALQGRERFLALNVTQSIGSVPLQILPLLIAWSMSPSVNLLIAGALFGRILTVMMLFVLCYRYVPLNRRPRFDFRIVRGMLTFGGWVTITAILGPLLATFDRIVIGALTGATALAHYVVPMNLVTRLRVVPVSLSSALFPRFALNADSNNSPDQDLPAKAVRAISSIMTPIVIFGIFFMEPFLALWINPEFAKKSAILGETLLVGVWFNSAAFVPNSLLIASGRPRVPALLYLVQIPPYALAMVACTQYWGVVGAAATWVARVILDAGMQFWKSGLPLRPFLPAFHGASYVSLSLLIVVLWPPDAAPRWIAGAIVILFSFRYAWTASPREGRLLVRGLTRRLGIVSK